jgi:ABC-2 type transport system permease protein
MNDIFTLLKPRMWSVKNAVLSKSGRSGLFRFLLLGLLGILFWGGTFAASLRVLGYFRTIPEVGDIISYKLLSMILITAFALLIFSSILTSLSKLYLSKDLFLVYSMPVPAHKIFIARWIDSTVESSWMVIVYTLPVFIAYGIVFDAGIFFYLTTFMAVAALSLIASAVSSLLIMLAVLVIPANRMKSIFIFLGLILFMSLYIAIRFLQPELLVDPDVFVSAMGYIKNLQTPSPPYLPSTWAFDSIRGAMGGAAGKSLFHLSISWVFASCLICLAVIVADAIYFKGFSKTQTGAARLFKSGNRGRSFLHFLPGPVRAFAVKEIKTFFRDQAQWSQLFLIAGLIVIYIYNFKAIPIEETPIKTAYLQNLLSFLNMGLALFVLIAITARFAYPAVTAEGEAFWIVKSAPLPLKTFLWIKFFVYYIPLLILSEILIISTNILLQAAPFMMILSPVSVFFMVPGIVAMGIGFGAAYPDFKAENPVQAVTSYGGLLFMIAGAGYIALVIMLQAGPVYAIFIADLRGKMLTTLQWFWIIGAFATTFFISILAIVLPMKFGERRLREA